MSWMKQREWVFSFWRHSQLVKQAQALDTLKLQLMQEVCELSKGIVWYREPFFLYTAAMKSTRPLSAGETLFYLKAETNVGDCIEDEWAIASILRTLSEKHPELIVVMI